jgi:hypothetical protein
MQKSKFRERGQAIAFDDVSHVPREAGRSSLLDGIRQLGKVRSDKYASTETWKLESVQAVPIVKTTSGQFGPLNLRGIVGSIADIAVGIQQSKEVARTPIFELRIDWEARLNNANYSTFGFCIATLIYRNVNHPCEG